MGFAERMSWWQWIALSLALGALLGYLNSGPANPSVEHSSVSPMIFETGLIQNPYIDPANPSHRRQWISGIVVHPVEDPRMGDKTLKFPLVTFTFFLQPTPKNPSGSTERAAMLAPYPYEPQPRRGPSGQRLEYPAANLYYGRSGDTLQSLAARFYHKATLQGVKAIINANSVLREAKNASELKIVAGRLYWIPWNPADGHTISDFLLAANKLVLREQGGAAMPVSFRYTWWESQKYGYEIWMIGSFLLVGVIWPALLRVMVKGGLGRTTEEEYLSRFRGAPEPAAVAAPAAAVMHDDMQRLRELEQNLEASLKASAPAVAAAASPQPAAPAVKKLGGEPAPAPAAPRTPEEKKSYEGEFYPVVKPGGKKEE